MNNSKPIILVLLICLVISIQCSKEVDPPSNLVVDVQLTEDGSGKIYVFADADNAKFYRFFFGEDPNETPTDFDSGNVSYTYKASGTYDLKVQAHSSESVFISESKTLEVKIFIAIPATGYSTPESYSGKNLIWSDEFNGVSIDDTKWSFEQGDGCPNCGWGNNELEFYKKENASILDGNLMIEAKTETVGTKNYTSARMISKGKFDFKYGRIDIRAVLPKGQGLWPAIWMLGSNISSVGWPACGEIDIMEMIGGTTENEKTVYGTLHWDNNGNHACTCDKPGYTLSTGTLSDRYHVFSLAWDSQYITWYVDDVQFNKIDITPTALSEFHSNFFLILNVAVGGNWPGNPGGNTQFPQRMFIDYIRVFQDR